MLLKTIAGVEQPYRKHQRLTIDKLPFVFFSPLGKLADRSIYFASVNFYRATPC